jgi:hypothetical protein
MEIKILGRNCTNCDDLARLTISALADLNIDTKVEIVTDIVKILSYNILIPPALVIGDKVVISGWVPTREELRELIATYQ